MEILSMEQEVRTSRDNWDEIDRFFAREKEPVDNDVAVIVLKVAYSTFSNNKKSYEYKIWGKSLVEWVNLAFDKCPILEIEIRDGVDILNVIKPYLSDKKYTAVFYADTPLLQRKTFLSIVDYAKNKRMNVCRLERGFVFVTEYLRTAEKLYSTMVPNLDFGNEFMIVKDMDSLSKASEILKKRILEYHLQNGVEIVDINWTSIDADVVIGDNVTIYPNNILQGKTVVGDNVILQTGNTIINSHIGNGCVLCNSVVDKSKIKDGTNLVPFSYVLEGNIKK